jgi:hypothetical protein
MFQRDAMKEAVGSNPPIRCEPLIPRLRKFRRNASDAQAKYKKKAQAPPLW